MYKFIAVFAVLSVVKTEPSFPLVAQAPVVAPAPVLAQSSQVFARTYNGIAVPAAIPAVPAAIPTFRAAFPAHLPFAPAPLAPLPLAAPVAKVAPAILPAPALYNPYYRAISPIGYPYSYPLAYKPYVW